MKNMRKIASVLLALVMVFALAAPVFAAETDANLSGHTYEAYQIFAGTQAENNATLGNITWGDGIDGTAFLTALKADSNIGTIFANCNTAADVAAAMTGWSDESDNAMAFAKIAYSHIIEDKGIPCENGVTPLNAGYYLVVDVTENVTNSAYNLALLQLTKKGEFAIANKTDVPEVEKKVKDINDSKDGDFSEWQDSADHDIFDSVPFQLTATLASNVSDYNTYKIIFHDTLSAGLTFDEITKVTVDGKDVTTGFDVNTAPNEKGGTDLTITFADVKQQGATDSSKIVVEYTATLNENANIGEAGNPNVVYLEYSNNPNWTGSGEPGTPGEPGGEEPEEPTGKTPEDKVIVFTFKVVANKIHQIGTNEEGKPVYEALVGAGFTLFKLDKESNEYEQIGEEVTGTQMTTFEWKGLDDGDYKLVETTTPDGYNTIADIYFTITAEHDVLSDNPTLTKLEGGDKFSGNVETGAVTGDIENKAGVELPETGGIGTTMFYIFGAVMVLGAAVLLVTKKRMSIAE